MCMCVCVMMMMMTVGFYLTLRSYYSCNGGKYQ